MQYNNLSTINSDACVTTPHDHDCKASLACRYLLRLGMGEQELATEMDFSRVGRVNAMLARRLELLAEVRHWGIGSLLGFNASEANVYSCMPTVQ